MISGLTTVERIHRTDLRGNNFDHLHHKRIQAEYIFVHDNSKHLLLLLVYSTCA